jgi:hypothetical protein
MSVSPLAEKDSDDVSRFEFSLVRGDFLFRLQRSEGRAPDNPETLRGNEADPALQRHVAPGRGLGAAGGGAPSP